MERDALLKKLSEFLNEAMMGQGENIKPDDILADMGLDSMGTVEFVTQVEDEFGFDEVSSEEISAIKTLNDAADMVLGRLEKK